MTVPVGGGVGDGRALRPRDDGLIVSLGGLGGHLHLGHRPRTPVLPSGQVERGLVLAVLLVAAAGRVGLEAPRPRTGRSVDDIRTPTGSGTHVDTVRLPAQVDSCFAGRYGQSTMKYTQYEK